MNKKEEKLLRLLVRMTGPSGLGTKVRRSLSGLLDGSPTLTTGNRKYTLVVINERIQFSDVSESVSVPFVSWSDIDNKYWDQIEKGFIPRGRLVNQYYNRFDSKVWK